VASSTSGVVGSVTVAGVAAVHPRGRPRAERRVQPAAQLDELSAAGRQPEHLGTEVIDRPAPTAAVTPTSA
jgi:hypothetical protein